MAQEEAGEIDATIEQIFNALTPKERVGQLFMVSFHEADLSPGSHIAELIQTFRVGGVIISAANKNFVNTSNTPVQVLELTNGLQRLAQEQFPSTPTEPVAPQSTLAITQTEVFTASPAAAPYNTLPLFIAVSHEGDGFPYTEIRGGLTDVPSQMALGATWDTENAYRIGQIVGHELSTLGVNMLLGPSLDVLDNPRPDRDGSLGTRTFGGNPYWVGEMSMAYIRGVHLGSDYRVLTVAKHFPGFGSSDRKINQGVPTILKSLDDLRRKELAPFFKVTQLSNTDQGGNTGMTDGLMTVHIRYQGLQGGAPISLDARNLPAILALKEIAPWRESGGFVVSAPLGVPAALEGTSATRDSFPARRLAWDALWAGNDILLVADFAFESNPDREAANIKNAIGFFQEKYDTDANFKAAVDKAVKRIIRAKVKVYGADLLNSRIEQPPDALERLKEVARSVDLDKIAQAGVTLITPATQEGFSLLTVPPQPNDKIVIFTDDRSARDCPDCPIFDLIRATALQEIILRLFGPDATGQIMPENITSLTFSELKEALDNESPVVAGEVETPGGEVAADSAGEPAEETLEESGEPVAAEVAMDNPAGQEPDASAEQDLAEPESPVTSSRGEITEAILNEADWVIFAMLNVDTKEYPESDAVKVLLRNRYETLRNKNLIVFAFSAPYFLDETEISQLTAYYCFYGSGLNYLEAAAKLLFQQFKPTGALPVGIPAVSPLDLSPDPNQTIQLELLHIIDSSGNPISVADQARHANSLDLKVGEGVLFRTSVIMDKNGNPVPDGTLVNFFRAYPKEGLSLEPLTVSTEQGIAEIAIVKERESPLQVTVSSNLAVQSVPFNIGPGIIDTPTPTPTFTPTPTEMPTPTPTLTPTPVVTSSPTPGTPEPTVEPGFDWGRPGWAGPVTFIDLAYALLGMVLVGGIAFSLGEDRFSLEERIRPALVAIAFGLVGYISYTMVILAFPRSAYLDFLREQGAANHWVAPLVSLLFAISSMIAWYLKPGRVFWVKSQPDEARPANRE